MRKNNRGRLKRIINGMINGTINGTIKLSETATIFAAIFSDEKFVQEVLAQIPWGLNIVILDKTTDKSIRRWYIEKTIKNAWSRNVLAHQRIFFERYE